MFDPNDVISKNYGIIIGSKDVDGLKYASWLNDNVINFYYEILQQEWGQQHNASTSFTSVRLYNTQFVTALYTANKTYNYDNVSRWSKALTIDMSSLDLLIIPINVDNYHWVCAALWLKTKTIEYYDSLGRGGARGLCRILLQYVHDDIKQYHPSLIHEYDMSSWTISIPDDIPKQSNGHDCGVFICMYADYIIRNIDLHEGIYATFNRGIVATHMQNYRMRILLQILHYNR
jgi:sentrin-specific protease 1